MDPKNQQYLAESRDITAGKKAEQALQESEALYNAIVNYIHDGLMVLDRGLHIVFANEAIKVMRSQVGLSADIVGKTLRETNPYLPENAEEEYYRIFTTGEATFGHDLFTLNGIRVYAKTWKMPVIEDGKVSRVIAIIRDITKHRLAEETIQERETQLRRITDNMLDMVLQTDLCGIIQYASPSHKSCLGYQPEDLQGKSIFDFVHPDDLGRVIDATQVAISTSSSGKIEYRIRHAEGHYIWLETVGKLLFDSEGALTGAIFGGRDITERKRAVDALQESEAQLRQITDNMLDIIAKIDEQGIFRYITPSIKTILGYDPQDLLGKFAFDYIHDDDQSRIMAAFQTAINLLSMEKADLRFKHADGHYLWLEVLGKGVVEDGANKRVIVSARDIADRKRAKEELDKYSEHLEELIRARTAELESFAYSVSHDLRAPLRSIHGFSQALLEDYGDRLDQQGKEYLERLKMSSKRMAELIDDLLDLSRITRTEMHREQVDLSALARSIVCELQMTQPERRSTIIIQEGLTAEGDLRLLRVMLENLLENAWKFTGRKPEAKIEFGNNNLDGRQVYSVRDNGAGFDMAYAGKLFNPFQRLHLQTEFPGTGIGLATIQRIVIRHGGRIWAEGEVEKGAVFYFTLS